MYLSTISGVAFLALMQHTFAVPHPGTSGSGSAVAATLGAPIQGRGVHLTPRETDEEEASQPSPEGNEDGGEDKVGSGDDDKVKARDNKVNGDEDGEGAGAPGGAGPVPGYLDALKALDEERLEKEKGE